MKDFEAWLDACGNWHVDDPVFNNRVKVIKSYKIGMSPAEIAKEYKIALKTVYNYSVYKLPYIIIPLKKF